MKAIIYSGVTVALTFLIAQRGVQAQTLPTDRLSQFSRDLTPSNAQDFFRAGQVQMEQEIRWLLEQRLAHRADILEVKSVILPEDRVSSPPPAPPLPKPLEKS